MMADFAYSRGLCMGPESTANRSAIIAVFASKSPSFMLFGVPGLKRTSIAIAVLIVTSVAIVSCGSSSKAPTTSGLSFRAFVSNPLQPATVGGIPVLNIVDARLDQLSTATASLNNAPSLMALFPSKRFTLVFSPANNSIAEIDNAKEAVTSGASGTNLGNIALPGATESMFVGTDNGTGYAAVPTAPVTGQSPGAVVVLNLSTGGITATLPVPNARYIVQSHNGNRILAFGNNTDPMHCGSASLSVVTVISPGLIGTGQEPRTFVCSNAFDHPVWGVFSGDDLTAYILSCGFECGGTSASVTPLNMTTNLPGTPIPVSAATIGVLNGSSLYVAGTPSGGACGNCGTLQVVDVKAATAAPPVAISDGYHYRMEMGANGQLFVGARSCSSACLSIFNIANSKVVIPSQNGDVTGIQPITNRTVVYVCQDGRLLIYDTTTDMLQTTQVAIQGQAVDVKLVD
jgi:hypothetical protein